MYNRSLKYKSDNKNVLDYAVEQGLEKGREEGLEQGREEERTKIVEEMKQLALEMKKNNEPIAKIIKYTKLTVEEIDAL